MTIGSSLTGTAPPETGSRDGTAAAGGQSLKGTVAQGALWSLIGSLANGILQFAVMIIMARLVAPADYGVMAMAQVFLRFASYFASFGIGTALVRSTDLGAEQLKAAFTGAWVLGVLFAGVMWMAAPLAARLYNANEVVDVARALALNFGISGFGIVSAGLLYRHMRFRALAVIGVFSYLVGYGAIGIPLACLGWGVWALVAAILAQTVLATAAQYLCASHPVGPARQWTAYRSLLGFGGQHSMAGFIEFLANSVDNFTLGRCLGDRALGLYSRASQLANLPIQLMIVPVMRVFYPMFVQARSDPARLRRIYCATLTAVSLMALPVGIAGLLVARDLVEVALGAEWTAGAPAFMAYALAIPAGLLAAVTFAVHDALGGMRLKIAVQAASLAVFALAIAAGLRSGIAGVAAGTLVGCLFRMFMEQALVHAMIGLRWRELARALSPALWIAAALLAIVWPSVWGLSLVPAWVRLVWVACLAPLVGIGVLLLARPSGIVPLAEFLRDFYPRICAWPPLARALARLVND